jgi:hypothetical protein
VRTRGADRYPASLLVTAGMLEWQNRPLDAVCPVVVVDCVHVKVRDGQVANRPVYPFSCSSLIRFIG